MRLSGAVLRQRGIGWVCAAAAGALVVAPLDAAARPERGSSGATTAGGGGTVYGGATGQDFPIVIETSKNGRKVLEAKIAIRRSNTRTRCRYRCVLFEQMGYKGGRKGKSGQYSTDQAILEGLAAQGAVVATKVLDWRQLTKLRSTYTETLQAAINPATGRVHTSYSLVGAQTGRLRRTIRTCRTSRSAPRSAARSATASSPSRAMSCSPPTTARSSCGSPRIWPTCRR